ncbi:expressed unknown protein [Seminavis robusta]|uniref:Uncharacterized protein n=1 Tax=Seminavis robusta TaxID=568900 RepID=A0A9N8E8T9_9STRA|nr:expressed unknown protein [Seminavis robusta]|eukprot:Sro635_g179061.1  (458) ;mRNA; f:4341-5808
MVKAKFSRRGVETPSHHSSHHGSSVRIRPSWILFAVMTLLVVFYVRLFVRLDEHTRELLNPMLLSIMTPPTTTSNTIGYFVSITKCPDPSITQAPLADGAAVLQHSIHLVHGNSKYEYTMHAIYHPTAAACVPPLAQLGYQLVERPTPVQIDEIQGEFLRSRIQGNGCCGEKELIKLEALTFTEFPIVVHVDLDVLILKPLDDLFDAMLQQISSPPDNNDDPVAKIQRMWPDDPVPEKINAFFTRDYGVVNWNIPYKPAQGGFLVLRPDKSVYEEYLAIVREGNFQQFKGWGGLVGPFYGAMTVQGLIPYYHDVLHPGETVVLNNCVYNNMCNNPTDQPTVKEVLQGKCRSGKTMDQCEDCRRRPLEDIVSAHFTLCQKPWFCLPFAQDKVDHRQCRKLVHEWFRIRSDLEKKWGRSGLGTAGTTTWVHRDQFYGYCSQTGKEAYIPIEQPYGKPTQ